MSSIIDLTVACIQMNSGPQIADNLQSATVLINEAAKAGAELIVTPENTDFIRMNSELAIKSSFISDEHPGIQYFSVLAKELKVWLLIGSMKIKVSDTKVANRSFLFNPKGHLMASYDKIHLFDVNLPDGDSFKESEFTEGGKQAVVASIDGRKLGMSICYDVRFPHLYRLLAQKGAEMMVVPSAFASMTGRDHWETLLRARAIETGSFIIAPAQYGEHEGGRKSHGHSMIISPWGEIMQEMTEDKDGYILQKLSYLKVAKARGAVPSLEHDQQYKFLGPMN